MVYSRFRLLQTNTTCSVQLVRRELKHSEGEWNKYHKYFSFLMIFVVMMMTKMRRIHGTTRQLNYPGEELLQLNTGSNSF